MPATRPFRHDESGPILAQGLLNPGLKQAAYVAVAAALGGLVAAGIHSQFLVKYRAVFGLPLEGNIELFRSAESRFHSVEWLNRYAMANKLEGSRAYEEMISQTAGGGGGSVNISHVFGVSRNDVRDLPPGVEDRLWPKLADGQPRQVSSVVEVAAVSTTTEQAKEVAEFAGGFVRDVLLRTDLSDRLTDLSREAVTNIATANANLSQARLDIASLSHQIAELTALRDRYDVKHDETAGGQLQVQIADARFPSPLQLLVGRESDKVEKAEAIRQFEQAIVLNQTIIDVAAPLNGIADKENDTLKAFGLVTAELERQRLAIAPGESHDVVEAGIRQIENRLAASSAGLATAPFQPPSPIVVSYSPRRSLVILLGILLGFAAGFVIVRGMEIRARKLN
jgi:hypothetical protein